MGLVKSSEAAGRICQMSLQEQAGLVKVVHGSRLYGLGAGGRGVGKTGINGVLTKGNVYHA